jgi:carboxymethylenebutenolidase
MGRSREDLKHFDEKRTGELSRRAFVAASAVGGYALAAGPVRAGTILTDTQGLSAGWSAIPTHGGDMPVYFARPQGVANPPVVLVAMEVFGLHEYIRDVVRRLAKLGAFAIAPDYYFRLGADLPKMTEIKSIMAIVNTKPDAELVADLDAAAAWAKAQGGDTGRLGIIGFCRGGRSVWIYCSESATPKAGVAFYGTLVDPPEQKAVWPKSPMDLAPELKAPVLGLYGGADQHISAKTVQEMKTRLEAAGKKVEFQIYPDAPHGFHADYRPSYRQADAEDAWRRMADWLRRYGVLG